MGPTSLTEGQHLSGALSRVLRWASRSGVRSALQGPQSQPLSVTDTWLLDAIVRTGVVRVSDLAEWQGVDKSTVTPQVGRLVARGLVERRSDDRDRRVALLAATEAGLALHQVVADAGAEHVEKLLAHWSAADRQALAELLTRFADEFSGLPALREPFDDGPARTAASA